MFAGSLFASYVLIPANRSDANHRPNNVQSINNNSHLPIMKQKEMSAVLSETSTVPSVQPHLSDDFEEMSDEYLSQAVQVIELTHLDLAATTVDVSLTATIVDIPVQFDSNGIMTLQSQENKCFSFKEPTLVEISL
uniref:Uncharacterized protein n=1 Tax=Magallana gigas TaxID=29159 RepID=K1RER7_MAGGI